MALGFGSYSIAKSGLYSNERALNVIGHNISNLNTAGYVRQQAVIADSTYKLIRSKDGFYQFGTGSDVIQIRQIRDQFLDEMYRKESMSYGYWEATCKTIQDVEAILGDPMSDGFQTVINNFWDSWQELSKEPESLTLRAVVHQRGVLLADTLNHIDEQLNKMQKDLITEINVRINEINDITSQIAKLNEDIYKYELSNSIANDYRDQRNILADRLSRLANANIIETDKGQLLVTIGGFSAVNGNKNKELFMENVDDMTPGALKFKGSDAEVYLKNGTVKGLLDSIGEIQDIKDMMNNLAAGIAEAVNSLHKSGKTMKLPPEDGADFFVSIANGTPITIGNIKINDDLDDLNNLVTSLSGENGDNAIALGIADLRHRLIITDETGMLTVDEYYQTIISRVGEEGERALNFVKNQDGLLKAANAKREAIFGVSLDEEMTNMMKFKFAYDASSRLFNAIDEMMETIINRMGAVGR